jgi:hypothetical protein
MYASGDSPDNLSGLWRISSSQLWPTVPQKRKIMQLGHHTGYYSEGSTISSRSAASSQYGSLKSAAPANHKWQVTA